MKRSPFLIAVLALLAVEAPSTTAQTGNPTPIGDQPCVAEEAHGRPTLKRRAPTPDTPVADEGRVAQKTAETDERKPQSPTVDSPGGQKPIRIEFEGLYAFTKEEMVRAFCEQRIAPQTHLPSSEVLAKAVAVMKELLETRGYFHATVDTREDPEVSAIVFLVSEGRRLPLAEVRFEGNKYFSSQELDSKIKGYLAYYAYFGKNEDGFDSDSFEFALRRVLNFVRSRGYLQAAFGEAKKEIDARGLVLSIPVDEGVLYRLGEIRIEGAEAVAPEKVRAMLGLDRGDIANGEALGKWLFEDLKKIYGELGFVEYTAEPEPKFRAAMNSANQGVVDFSVRIEEGRRFRLHTIKFQGSGLTDEELLRLLPIRAGDVFNQRLWEESISELNKSGLFKFIDKDRDADFKTDEEQGLIDIVIKLRNSDGEVEPGLSYLNRRQP